MGICRLAICCRWLQISRRIVMKFVASRGEQREGSIRIVFFILEQKRRDYCVNVHVCVHVSVCVSVCMCVGGEVFT